MLLGSPPAGHDLCAHLKVFKLNHHSTVIPAKAGI